MKRRAQPAVTIRSSHAVDRLKLLTRDGRSQVEVIEEALDRMPLPPLANSEIEERLTRLMEILDRHNAGPEPRFKSMAEYDAWEYDENGNPRPASDYDADGNLRDR